MQIMAASTRQAAGLLFLLLIVTVPTAEGKTRKQIVEKVNVSIGNILANLDKLRGIVITTPKPLTTPAVTLPTTTPAVTTKATTTITAEPTITTTTAVPITTTTPVKTTTTSETTTTTQKTTSVSPDTTTTEKTTAGSSEAPTTTEESTAGSSEAPTTTEETTTGSSEAPTTTEETTTGSSEAPTTSEETTTGSSEAPTTSEETTIGSSEAPTTTEETTTKSSDSTVLTSMSITSTTSETTPEPTNTTTIRRRLRSLRKSPDGGSFGSGPLETWRRLRDEVSTAECEGNKDCDKLVAALEVVDTIVSEMDGGDGDIKDDQVTRADNADKDVDDVVKVAQTDSTLQEILNDNIGYIDNEIKSITEDKNDMDELYDNLKSKATLGIVLGSIAGALVVIGLVGAGYFYYQKRRKNAVPEHSTYE